MIAGFSRKSRSSCRGGECRNAAHNYLFLRQRGSPPPPPPLTPTPVSHTRFLPPLPYTALTADWHVPAGDCGQGIERTLLRRRGVVQVCAHIPAGTAGHTGARASQQVVRAVPPRRRRAAAYQGRACGLGMLYEGVCVCVRRGCPWEEAVCVALALGVVSAVAVNSSVSFGCMTVVD